MTVTARRATSLGESESSLVEDDDDDDDDEFVIVRTHAHTHKHTRSNTQRAVRCSQDGGRALACRPSWTTNRPLDAGPWTVDEGRSLKQLARSWRY